MQERFAVLSRHLDERGRRMFAAAEAKAAGYGGIAAASRATGIAVSTINRTLKELAGGSELVLGQIRRPGGGRKSLVESDAGLMGALLALVEPSTRGDPETPLRWTYKSVRRLAAELSARVIRSVVPWFVSCCTS
jgi:Rhodopirellula transposase DDE domain